MKLEEAIAAIEMMVPSVAGKPYAISETGEAYVCIKSGGIHREGDFTVGWSDIQGMAVDYFARQVYAYIAEKSAAAGKDPGEMKLYWRIKPEISERPVYCDESFMHVPTAFEVDTGAKHHALILQPLTLYGVYARLLVTDQPVLQAAEQDA